MSSGQKREVINTRERVVSTDINDLQDFIAKARAESMRRLYQRHGTQHNPLEYPESGTPVILGTETQGTLHDCIGGLMVRPDNGSFLLVDPGTAGFYYPGYSGATANDSPYVVVDDPGVTSNATLTFTANGSGNPRIDIVECRPVDTTLATESRDIYNTTTGQFVPASVPKVKSAVLEYRVRLGTANAGFPAIDQQWMPLAMVVVQSGATGFTQCDVYDVRPLVGERDHRTGPYFTATLPGNTTTGDLLIEDRMLRSDGTTNTWNGWLRASYQGYRVAGMVVRNVASSLADFGTATTGGGDTPWFEYRNTENHITTGGGAVVNTAGRLNCLALLFPRGLGRCVRYTQNSTPTSQWPDISGPQTTVTGRQPRGLNGILVVTGAIVANAVGTISTSALPATFGNSANNDGFVVGWLISDGTNLYPYDCTGKEHTLQSNTFYTKSFTVSGLPAINASHSVTLSAASAPDHTADAGQYPRTAAKLKLNVSGSADYSGAPNVAVMSLVTVTPSNQSGTSFPSGSASYPYGNGSSSISHNTSYEIPVPGATYPGDSSARSISISRILSLSGGPTITTFTAVVSITGWFDA